MAIKDIYLLCKSDEFYLKSGHEASINLSLERAPPLLCTKLHGKVVSGCRPVSGATVKVFDKNFNPLYHTITDHDGYYSFINALKPGVYEIIAAADGYLISQSRLISLLPHKSMYVTLQLQPDKSVELATVYGVIRDEKNEPLPGTLVYIFNCNDADYPSAVTISNADGEYLVSGLKPGQYWISAFREGFSFPEKIHLSVLPKEMVCADLYLYIDLSATGTVSGKVVFNGSAVPHALTALYLTEYGRSRLIKIQKSNHMGFYLFTGLKPGKYVVKAKLESHGPPLPEKE
ncbi:MSCRAMM family protein [Papillibacter cinnamivorans]|uniref:Carboxypeptidase regulatory-like domain-containing protein n=1 Tax=Papillibacter cinnamivorans DSM 12816 TaxID=1122930 RepID=A0A1W1YFG7_9FIRM|nr:carboxypeptidase-like regulatory domain-containing protein [Papillibacter cinnamivorans]SMC34571.1 Carboxypeptidase regulatory-like domain-containing protein [Papillibacter cinnamivorans DSM 12816]